MRRIDVSISFSNYYTFIFYSLHFYKSSSAFEVGVSQGCWKLLSSGVRLQHTVMVH